MERAILPRSAPVSGEHPRDPVPQASESAVSSTSLAVEPPALTIPTPPSPPSPPPLTQTPAPTLTVRTVRMSAS